MTRTITVVLFAALLAIPAHTAEAGRTTAYGTVVNNSSGRATVTGRKYYCSSGSYHGALDLAAPCGKWLRANLRGRRYYRYKRVQSNTCRRRVYSGYGNYFVHSGRNGFQFLLAHVNHSKRLRSRSRYYKRGQGMAYVGSTGNSTGPHTHVTNMRNWTPLTFWFTHYNYRRSHCGRHPGVSYRIGRPRLSL